MVVTARDVPGSTPCSSTRATLDLIVNQACDGYHFAEWNAAIHLFGRDGACSVMEKYDTWENHYLEHRRKRHLDKVALCERVVPEERRAAHHEICARYRVPLPDLLVLAPDGPTASPRSRAPRTARSTQTEGWACAPTFARGWAWQSK
jgi:hypothetical protein